MIEINFLRVLLCKESNLFHPPVGQVYYRQWLLNPMHTLVDMSVALLTKFTSVLSSSMFVTSSRLCDKVACCFLLFIFNTSLKNTLNDFLENCFLKSFKKFNG